MSFDTVLIANRGEIAVRIARTARRMGLRSVSIYTAPDRSSPHVSATDQSVFLDDLPGRCEPYLDIERVIDAARRSGAQAVHPGYGFLSENAKFAQACVDAGLVFIGPGVEAIRIMGDKGEAKRLLKGTDVPCVPGFDGDNQSDERLASEARMIGVPILIKAVAGGGGRGMRRVEHLDDFAAALRSARSEAGKAFGSEDVILERALDHVRHIEIQVFGDSLGNVIHLGERDCSAQRRNQKVIEEAPSPAVDAALRGRIGAAAVEVAKAVGYVGAGTVEFLLTRSGEFYFIEMNTRLQVEHPVTEEVTGLDLVEWQLRVAAGEPLPLPQQAVTAKGAAIEVRLYAEDPEAGFTPQTGMLREWVEPRGEGVRFDHAMAAGTEVGARYDPMIGKLIAWGSSREIARRRLVAALKALRLSGLITNRAFLIELLEHPTFKTGQVDTGFIAGVLSAQRAGLRSEHATIAVAVAYWTLCRRWNQQPDDWSTLGTVDRPMRLNLNGAKRDFAVRAMGNEVEVRCDGEATPSRVLLSRRDDIVDGASIDGVSHSLSCWSDHESLTVDFGTSLIRAEFEQIEGSAATNGSDGVVSAPMDGRLIAVEVEIGDRVVSGQRLLVLEAMKMEHHILAPLDGLVVSIAVKAGEQVGRRRLLLVVESQMASAAS